MEWQPIETAPIGEFAPERWHKTALRCLIWNGHFATIGRYGFTQGGKGRWKDEFDRVATPTHWMPLPDAPE